MITRAVACPLGCGASALASSLPESAGSEDQALAGYDNGRKRCSSIGVAGEARMPHVHHARLDAEPCQRVHDLVDYHGTLIRFEGSTPAGVDSCNLLDR